MQSVPVSSFLLLVWTAIFQRKIATFSVNTFFSYLFISHISNSNFSTKILEKCNPNTGWTNNIAAWKNHGSVALVVNHTSPCQATKDWGLKSQAAAANHLFLQLVQFMLKPSIVPATERMSCTQTWYNSTAVASLWSFA